MIRFALIAIALVYVLVNIFAKKTSNQPPANPKEKTATVDTSDNSAEKPVESTSEPQEDIVTESKSEQSNERIQALEEKITSMETMHANALAELKTKLEIQKSDTHNKVNNILSSFIMFGQLKDDINNGKPYGIILSQLKTALKDNTQAQNIIINLEEHSESGIKTASQLKTEFSPLIKQALTNKDESAFLKIFHKFITIRKIGNQAGDNNEAILARAENKLSKNELSAALEELENLPKPTQELFANWIADTQTLINTTAYLNNLHLTLTQTKPVVQP